MSQSKESQVTSLVWRTDLKTLQKHKKVAYIVNGRKVSCVLKCFQDRCIKYLQCVITYHILITILLGQSKVSYCYMYTCTL